MSTPEDGSGQIFGVEFTKEDRCLGIWFLGFGRGDLGATIFQRTSGDLVGAYRFRYYRDSVAHRSTDIKNFYRVKFRPEHTSESAVAAFQSMVELCAAGWDVDKKEICFVDVPEGADIIEVLMAQSWSHMMINGQETVHV